MGLEVDRSHAYIASFLEMYRWGWKWTGTVASILESLRYDGAGGTYFVRVVPITVYSWGLKWAEAAASILESLRYDGASGKYSVVCSTNYCVKMGLEVDRTSPLSWNRRKAL